MIFKLKFATLLLAISISSCANVIFPKYFFNIYPIFDTPSFSSSSRFDNVERYKQEIAFSFSQPGNSFNKKFKVSLFVQKPYQKIEIKEIRYESPFGNGSFLENATFALPQKVVPEGTKPLPSPDHYFEQDGYYWSMFLLPVDKFKPLPEVNFQKVFKKQKTGDRFNIVIYVEYKFDNEDYRTAKLDYQVSVVKNKLVTPMMGW